jgi:predicted DCC family thiol-disulfide oxidoreductase YuxK
MTHINSLPAPLAQSLTGKNLIVFDGTCIFCSAFFRFIVKHDRNQNFHFATAQSPLGQALYAALNLPLTEFETNLVITNGAIYQRLDAFAAAMAQLRQPWRTAKLLRYLPNWIKDAIYKPIARNRYRIFGRSDACLIPDVNLKSRFLTLPT